MMSHDEDAVVLLDEMCLHRVQQETDEDMLVLNFAEVRELLS